MNISTNLEVDRKKTKKFAWVTTVIYLILLPFLFMFAAASILIFDSPSMPVPFGLSVIFLCFCVPLSIPYTFYLVWSRYSQGEYKKSRQFCLLPFYIAMATMAYDALGNALLRYFS